MFNGKSINISQNHLKIILKYANIFVLIITMKVLRKAIYVNKERNIHESLDLHLVYKKKYFISLMYFKFYIYQYQY